MTIPSALISEFDQEMQTTRRVLERVPSDNGAWKPHDKSFAIGHLAQLVATMPGWISRGVLGEDIDLASGPGYSLQSTESLLDQFDQLVAAARSALAEVTEEDFGKPWSLKMGDKVIFTLPRSVVTRQNISHLIHHRGQLTVYLRLLDVAVPSTYGPTADEPWQL